MSDKTYNVIDDEQETDELFKAIGSSSKQSRSRSHSSPPFNETRVLQFSNSTFEGKRAKKIVTFATPPRFNRSYEAESVNRAETLTLYRPTEFTLPRTVPAEDPSVQINSFANATEEESNFQLYETRPSFRLSDSLSPTNSIQNVSKKESFKLEINFSVDLAVDQTQASSDTYVNKRISDFGDRTHVIATPACNPQLAAYESQSFSGSPDNATHVINSPIIKLTRNEQETLTECSVDENEISTEFTSQGTSTLTAHLFEQSAHIVVKKPLSTIDEISPPDQNSIPQTPILPVKTEPNMTFDLITPIRQPGSCANRSALASLNHTLLSLTSRYKNSTLNQHNITETPVKWREETSTLLQRCNPFNGPVKLRCIDAINWAQEPLPPPIERKPSIYVPLPIDQRCDLNDPRSKDSDWLKAQRMVVRVINKFEGDMRLARDHIVELHAKHVQKITPLDERSMKSLEQLRQLENKYEQRWTFRNQLIEGIRKKKDEEIEEFIASVKSRVATAIVKFQVEFPTKVD